MTALLLVPPLASCAFEEGGDSLDSEAKRLVFNDRNVQQLRGQVLLAGSKTGADRIIPMMAALHSRASGIVRVPAATHWELVPGDGLQCVIKPSIGSGTLSTDTVAVTARHVIGHVPGRECGQVRVSCHGANPFGLAVGVLGGSKFSEEVNEGVGSFYLAWAPWYDVSYHLNWKYITVQGRTLAESAGASLIHASGLALYQYLRRSFERRPRQDFGDTFWYLRPASMKLCPPAHYLSGIQASFDTSTEEVEGTTGIWCLSVDAEESSDAEFHPLDAPDAKHQFTFSTPILAPGDFSLDQLLGDPDPVSGNIDNLKCDEINGDLSAIRSVAFDYEDQNVLKNLAIACDTLP